jgi:sulfhydrogenase subunit beta (sulfur reductase)
MNQKGYLSHGQLPVLFQQLQQDGYQIIGPQLRDAAIQYRELETADDLPWGINQTQFPGEYRLQQSEQSRAFAWANGPQALKPYLFAPHETLWSATHGEDGTLSFSTPLPEGPPLAVIGVRACDLAALALHDRHFLGETPDAHYAARREKMLLIAVNCSHPAATCFCASTGDGPSAEYGFDLVLDELDDGFLVEAGSDAGAVLLERMQLAPAAETQQQAATEQSRAAALQQRALPAGNLRETLFANLEHAHWQEVGERCLACGNCTSVCPTCFCHGEQEVPALDGSSSDHIRQWDSCFSAGHSYIHGLVIRAETSQRYRQWLTHKLGSWHEQFGRSGCVGCGRCISWCPVGIDITEEAAAICGGGQ